MKNKFIILLIFVSLISGIFWAYTFGDPFPQGDGVGYDRTALLILEKGLFNNDDWMNCNIEKPFYPVFLAGIYKVFGHNYEVTRVIQILLFVFLSLLVYSLCRKVFDERVAKLASLMTALCYTIAAYSGWFYRELFFCFLVFLMVYCLYQAQLKNRNIWFVVSGIVTGIAFLTNAIIQFFILVIIINFFIIGWKQGFRNVYPKVAVFFIAFSLIISPWLISNYLNFGRTPFGSKNGFFLSMRVEKMQAIKDKYFQHLVGNALGDFFAYKWFDDYNPKEVRLGWQNFRIWGEITAREEVDRKIFDQQLAEEAKKEIFKHPLLFLQMSSIDFLKFNTPMMPDIRIQNMFVATYPELSDFTKGSIILFIRFVYLMFFVLIIYAIVKNIKSWQKVSWLILIVLYFNLIFSNLHAIARYSVPVYPFYIILSAVGIIIFWDKIKRNKKKRLINY